MKKKVAKVLRKAAEQATIVNGRPQEKRKLYRQLKNIHKEINKK